MENFLETFWGVSRVNVIAHNKERAIFHLLFVHRVKRILGGSSRLETNETLASQSILVAALHAGGLDLSEFSEHCREFLVVGAGGEVLDVEVVAVALLFVFVVGNLNFLATKLSLVSILDAVVSVLLLRKLDEAEPARLAVGLLELEGLDLTVLGEVGPKLLLRKLGRQVAHDDIGLVIEAVLNDAHVDGGAVNLSVIHFLLAFLGLLDGRKVEEAKPIRTLGLRVLLDFHLGIEHFVATAFEVLEEVQIVKVLGEISDVHGGQLVFLLDRGRPAVALLILSRWLVVVFSQLQHVLKQAH